MFVLFYFNLFLFKQKAAYELRISDWSSDVCSSDLRLGQAVRSQLFASGQQRPPYVRTGSEAQEPIIQAAMLWIVRKAVVHGSPPAARRVALDRKSVV